jgi:hypothetical protein
LKAHALLEGAVSDPNRLKIVSHAFDAAWLETYPLVSPSNREAASFKLAAAVLRTACSGVTGVEQLKSAAIASMFAGPPEL